MSLFKREQRSITGLFDPGYMNPLWASRRGGYAAGQTVNADTADRLMAVWRCKHLLADLVSGLPIDQYRQQGKNRKEMPQSEFVRTPSDLIEQDEWCYSLMLSALEDGNAFSLITKFGSDGLARRAEVVPNSEMDVTQAGFLAPPKYKISGKEVDSAKILHLRAFGPKPGTVMGLSPIRAMAPTVGLGLAVREFGASWYAGGGHPTTLLSTAQAINDEQASGAKESFRHATTNDHIAVLGNGWDLKSVQQAPSDALFLNATNATTVDICGYYGVPPEFLGYANSGTGSVTYANREQRILDLLTMTVGWWVGRIERLISRQIPQPQYVKKNVDALLRSDAATRWNIHKIAVGIGARNPNGVLRLEDEDPRTDPGGDAYVVPKDAFAEPVMNPDAPTGGATP